MWILSVLASEPQHGYGILKSIHELSGGAATPQVGSLYRTIDRLEQHGLITVNREEIVDGRTRRYYELTDSGRTDLAATVAELAALARIAEQRLATGAFTRRSATPRLGTAQ